MDGMDNEQEIALRGKLEELQSDYDRLVESESEALMKLSDAQDEVKDLKEQISSLKDTMRDAVRELERAM